MPYSQTAKTEKSKPNFPEGDKGVSASANGSGWKRIVVEIIVLSAMFIIAATFALLPTAYSLWKHF